MNIPQFRATLKAVRRRESGRQLRMMHAVFNAAAPCVSGKMEAFNSESKRLEAESLGLEFRKTKSKTSTFAQLLARAKMDKKP